MILKSAEIIDNEPPNKIAGSALIVDDDPTLCKAYRRILEKKGYEVHLAHSLKDADQLLSMQKFDVIIADIFLGSEDGLLLLKQNSNHNMETPVIVMTGEPSLQTATHALRLNAYDYLQKPISSRQLSQAVSRAVEFHHLKNEKKRFEIENQYYQKNLEQIVESKTAKLTESNRRYERLITSYKQAERQIKEQNKFLKNILDSLTHPFMVIDANDFSIKMANAAAVQSDLIHGEMCQKKNHDIYHPCNCSENLCTVRKVIDNKKPNHTQHIHSNKAGEQRTYEVHAFPLFNKDGSVTQVIQYCIDITEKNRLETIAEAANLMDNLGYIFSGIRHEIGNPLNSVKMALTVLSKNIDIYDKKTMGEFINRSLSELSRVEYLLKALKNFSLFESPVVESVNMVNFTNNFVSLVQDDFRRKSIRITPEIASDAIWVKIDHRALHHILLNLMTNSADALNDCNKPEIRIVVSHEPEWIQIKVIDNGRGISNEEMHNIFKPFFTTKPHGTGLGLVIVKKMVSEMEGSIKINSRKNRGTTVTMFFPEGDAENDQNPVGN